MAAIERQDAGARSPVAYSRRVDGTLIYETVHGSRAYGLAIGSSDLDRKGVLVGPARWYHGYLGGPEQIEITPDHVRFEIRKLFRLASASNPTLIELLWTDPEHHLVLTPAGEKLLALRADFLSRRVRESFGGYALAQLRRIRTHRGWLLHPPAIEPRRADFGLPESTAIPRDQLGAAEALLSSGRIRADQLPANFLDVLERERRWKHARRDWEQHRTWLKERNPARAELEARHGYDTKHAMHLVRLLRMGVEILETGRVIVKRPDRDELLAIRAGSWTYEELEERAAALEARLDAAGRATALPAEPDTARLDAACAAIVEEVLG